VVKKPKDLPAIDPLIEVMNPEDQSKWLTLEAYYKWEQHTPPEEERYQIPRRDIWYALKSYIVKRSDMDELFEWAKKQNFWNDWMPRSDELTNVFLGEFFWSPAFVYHDIPYYYHNGWTRGRDNKIPKEVLVSTDGYMREDSLYDCSIEETIHISLPAKWLVDHMDLGWNRIEGHFYDSKGTLIAFDPSTKNSGAGALLINRDVFLKFLGDNGYDILWTIIGEKRIIGGNFSRDDWQGQLELNGAYRIHQNQVCGAINPKFRSRN